MPVEQNDKPKIELDLKPDGLRASWGPKNGPWGIFKEHVAPVDVEIKEWWLYVGTLKNASQEDGESEPIFSDSVGTVTQKTIPMSLLPQHKKVTAQVIGYFDSEKPNGEKFREGIYSDTVVKEIKLGTSTSS